MPTPPRWLLPALAFLVSVSYGVLFYGFSVLITKDAAGGTFTGAVLSMAYGGAVLTSGFASIPVGRVADANGVRWILATGSLLGGLGLWAFSLAAAAWQVVAVWWALLGPVMAMTFYEPAFVAVQQWYRPVERPRAIAMLTLAAGLSGPVAIPTASALVEAVGWRDTARILGAALVLAGVAAAGLVPRGSGAEAQAIGQELRLRLHLRAFVRPRLAVFTVGVVLAYGALEALIFYRVARFEEAGFAVASVAFWAALSGLLTLPGRFLLPWLGHRVHGTILLGVVLGGLALATAFAIPGDRVWEMAAFFTLSGLVFGAALPLRAVVMSDWHGVAGFGSILGVQTLAIAGGRAGGPPLVGGLHQATGSYATPMVVLVGLFAVGAVLVLVSRRFDSRDGPQPELPVGAGVAGPDPPATPRRHAVRQARLPATAAGSRRVWLLAAGRQLLGLKGQAIRRPREEPPR